MRYKSLRTRRRITTSSLEIIMQAQLGLGAEYVTFDWCPEDGTFVKILRLDGSGIARQFLMRPWFSFHFANTFEAEHPELGHCVAVDVTLNDTPQSVSDLWLHNMRDDPTSDITPMRLKCVPVPFLMPPRTP
jgi:carotenoid cleavage dioxygenase-like enzyme